MRSMMQGIVTEGTGKEATLNGYSSAGKTGTAQKIDPATHTYSHTKLVASFAGFAPVSNPAIAVTVVIDNPTVGPSKYGGAVSAPVFAQVAQEVLEYLGVPHDQPLKTPKELVAASQSDNVFDDSPSDNIGDLEAMFADVNNLPADDPLRNPDHPTDPPAETSSVEGGTPPPPAPPTSVTPARTENAAASNAPHSSGTQSAAKSPVKNEILDLLPAKVLAAFRAQGGTSSTMSSDAGANATLHAPTIDPAVAPHGNGAVVVDSRARVAVPSFAGAPLRTVIEQAGKLGLRVEPVGSGLAREQVPAAGTMVPAGTQIAVRFSR
jgi:cell division protein FtsI (penicillin-binding protein 3)